MARDKVKKPKKAGSKPKYDYTDEAFLSDVETKAAKGFTDKEIAHSLNLNPTYFCEKKSATPELSKAISRGRAAITRIVRAKFLAMAMGGIKVKSTVTRKIRFRDGTTTDDEEIQTTETELAPSLQAQQTWLLNNDPEWRPATQKVEVEMKGGFPIESWIRKQIKK